MYKLTVSELYQLIVISHLQTDFEMCFVMFASQIYADLNKFTICLCFIWKATNHIHDLHL